MNIAELLATSATREPDRPALTFGNRSATYAELRQRVAELGGGLLAAGARPGDRVVLFLPNAPELVEVLLATMWAGMVPVPLNWHLHPEEAAYVVEHCEATAVLVAAETEALLDRLPAGVLALSAGAGRGRPLSEVSGEAIALAEVSPDDPAWLFYTSGTTGRPKGATLSHRNLRNMTMAYYADIDRLADATVFVHAAPLTHGSGLYLLPGLGRAAHHVISAARGFDPDDFMTLLARHQATHATFMAPTMLQRLVTRGNPAAHDLCRLRSIVVGGAPLYRSDLRAATEAFGPIIQQIYGQGESPMTITVSRPPTLDELGEDDGSIVSCGQAFCGVQMQIVDADGVPVPPGTDGEVRVRGDVVMRGYWKDAGATEAALRDGWLHTGDIGHVDERGNLFLTDRAKDVIITGGSNVYPREVEEALLTHAAVAEVAVIGRPDAEWGESVCAFVVPAPQAQVQPDDLIEHCKQRLASFKKPKQVVFVDALPKSAAGKILKRELRER